eukprot:1762612-Rhodomonas_salina.1
MRPTSTRSSRASSATPPRVSLFGLSHSLVTVFCKQTACARTSALQVALRLSLSGRFFLSLSLSFVSKSPSCTGPVPCAVRLSFSRSLLLALPFPLHPSLNAHSLSQLLQPCRPS